MTRRDFLRQTATGCAALALPTIIPARALGRDGHVAPSNRIVTGHIGLNQMGVDDMKAFLARDDVQVRGVCDLRWSRCLGAWGICKEAAQARNPSVSDPGVLATTDFRELLTWEEIDAVAIATPDHWHALITIAAARAGKDIYCQKPMTHDFGEGLAVVDAVRRHARILQVGSQQRSSRDFRFACELVRNGRIGQVREVEVGLPNNAWLPTEPPATPPKELDYDFWVGPAPWEPYTEHRTDFTWRWHYNYGGSIMADWGAHHFDIMHWGLDEDSGGPIHVETRGVLPADGLTNVPLQWGIEMKYRGGIRVTVLNENIENGVRFIGDKGWVFVNRARIDAEPKKLLATQWGPGDTRLYVSTEHHANFIDCIHSRRDPVTPVEVGHRTTTACHLANIAWRSGFALDWDPVAQKLTNDVPLAERMLHPPMRAPWRLS